MSSVMRGRIALGMLLWLCAPIAFGQYDPTAPEPTPKLRGAFILSGGKPSEAAYARRDAIENRAPLVDGPEPGDKALIAPDAPAPKYLRAGVRQIGVFLNAPETPCLAPVREQHFGEMAEESTRRALRSATLVELFPGALDLPADQLSELAAALRDVVERGGVVMASGVEAARLAAEYLDPKTGAIAPGLDVLPGAAIRPVGADQENDAPWKHNAALVGLSLTESTSLVVSGRRIEVLEGSLPISLAASHVREAGVSTLNAGEQLDLIELTRAAAERGRRAFPRDKPSEPRVEHGSLVIIGGGGMPRGLMQRFVQLAGGREAFIVCLPCDEADEVPVEEGLLNSMRRAGAGTVVQLHTKDRSRANFDEEFLTPLRSATGIWFGGGRQWNLVDSYQNTTVHKLIEEVLERGGAIAGSSAGASIQSEYMPRGSPRVNTIMCAEGYEQGLGLLRGAAVDQHFTQRRRGPDLEKLVTQFPQYLGIGIDETTAIIVQGSRAEVVGESTVNFYDARSDALTKTSLTAGSVYDLVERRKIAAEPQPQ